MINQLLSIEWDEKNLEYLEFVKKTFEKLDTTPNIQHLLL